LTDGPLDPFVPVAAILGVIEFVRARLLAFAEGVVVTDEGEKIGEASAVLAACRGDPTKPSPDPKPALCVDKDSLKLLFSMV
jgi:hypothetical protein